MDFLNFNSIETLPGFEARAAFTVNSATVACVTAIIRCLSTGNKL